MRTITGSRFRIRVGIKAKGQKEGGRRGDEQGGFCWLQLGLPLGLHSVLVRDLYSTGNRATDRGLEGVLAVPADVAQLA